MDAWQRIINKDVSFEQTVSILAAAKERGFKLAKFYFMIGLPVPGGADAEADAIIGFFSRIQERVRIQLNVNVGTFVPKAHTPFQWSPQVSEDEALAAIHKIKDGLRRQGSIKVSYHSPFVSLLEGVISRGDERVGGLILEAFNRGARLDAWDEHFNRELWREVLSTADWDVIGECLRGHDPEDCLPWDDVGIGVGKRYLRRELQRSRDEEFTSGCAEKCTDPCGACHDIPGVVKESIPIEPSESSSKPESMAVSRMVFRFTKRSTASYLPHLAIVEAMQRAFSISGLPVLFSSGFNPMPRLELVQPLPIGVASEGESASVLLRQALSAGEIRLDEWIDRINRALPEGLRIYEAREFPIHEGKKIHSLNGLSWGSRFRVTAIDAGQDPESIAVRLKQDLVSADLVGFDISLVDGNIEILIPDPHKKEESLFRRLDLLLGDDPDNRLVQARIGITRIECMARSPEGATVPYLNAFSDMEEQGLL